MRKLSDDLPKCASSYQGFFRPEKTILSESRSLRLSYNVELSQIHEHINDKKR